MRYNPVRNDREIFLYRKNNGRLTHYRVYAKDGQTYIGTDTDYDWPLSEKGVTNLIQELKEAPQIRAEQASVRYRDRRSENQEFYFEYVDTQEVPPIYPLIEPGIYPRHIRVVVGWGKIYLDIYNLFVEFAEERISEVIALLQDPPTMDYAYRNEKSSKKQKRCADD